MSKEGKQNLKKILEGLQKKSTKQCVEEIEKKSYNVRRCLYIISFDKLYFLV